MPSWLIILLAIAVLVLGVAAVVGTGARRSRDAAMTEPLAALRARAEALRYRIDATDGDTSEARRLVDSAEATFAAAREHRSRSALYEAAATLRAAEAALERPGGRRE